MNKETVYDDMIMGMTESLFDHIKCLERDDLAIFLSNLFPHCENCPIKSYCEGHCYDAWMDALFLPYKNWMDIITNYRVDQLIKKGGDK